MMPSALPYRVVEADRADAVLARDGGYRLLPVEPGAGLSHFAESVLAQCQADLADEVGLADP